MLEDTQKNIMANENVPNNKAIEDYLEHPLLKGVLLAL